jgi:ABC-type uncharacterized transport system permease subunit
LPKGGKIQEVHCRLDGAEDQMEQFEGVANERAIFLEPFFGGIVAGIANRIDRVMQKI